MTARRVGGRLELDVVGDDDTGEPVLLGSSCPTCGDVAVPPRAVCWRDLATTRQVPLSGRGTLYEAVLVELPPSGFDRPYWAAYVDLDEGPRLFAPLAWPEEPAPAHGARVVARIEPIRQGDTGPIIGPVFRPAVRPKDA